MEQPAPNGFPTKRPRRLRQHPRLRDLVRENQLTLNDLIYPLFVYHGQNLKREISSMPGQFQLSLDRLPEVIDEVSACKVPAVLLFGIPEHKDPTGSSSWDEAGIVQEAVRTIRRQCIPSFSSSPTSASANTLITAIADRSREVRGSLDVDNDATLELLARQAVSHAQAGADVIAPSGMMDGMVSRHPGGPGYRGLFPASPFCRTPPSTRAPFMDRFATPPRVRPAFGDRRSYQMDPANGDEALREVALDLSEGADLIMVKPGLPYLDIVRRVKDRFEVPVAAYNVSGEYSMVKAAAQHGWIDEKRIVLELLTGFKRAGADMILTYHALDAARWLPRARLMNQGRNLVPMTTSTPAISRPDLALPRSHAAFQAASRGDPRRRE